MKRIRSAAAIAALVLFLWSAAAANADAQPSVYGQNAGPLTLWNGSTHSERGQVWVQRHPVVYLVFWGPNWSTDSTGIVAAEETMFRELAGTAYNGLLQQYGVANDVRLGGVYFDSSTPGLITDRSLADESTKASWTNDWRPSLYAQWIILPELGADLRHFSNECGEHDDLTFGRDRYFVALIPPFQSPEYGEQCIEDYSGGAPGNAAPSLVAATTSLTSHEYAEIATDPQNPGFGWKTWNADDVEIADLCEWYSGTPAGMTVNVSYLWSDLLQSRTDGCTIGS